jgi:hypothetical protein
MMARGGAETGERRKTMQTKIEWAKAYAEWVEINAAYQEALIECREGESFFPSDLAEAEYQAEQRVIRAWQICQAVAPLNMCAELRAEWRANGGI